jgi:hypothetical protein
MSHLPIELAAHALDIIVEGILSLGCVQLIASSASSSRMWLMETSPLSASRHDVTVSMLTLLLYESSATWTNTSTYAFSVKCIVSAEITPSGCGAVVSYVHILSLALS